MIYPTLTPLTFVKLANANQDFIKLSNKLPTVTAEDVRLKPLGLLALYGALGLGGAGAGAGLGALLAGRKGALIGGGVGGAGGLGAAGALHHMDYRTAEARARRWNQIGSMFNTMDDFDNAPQEWIREQNALMPEPDPFQRP